MNETQFKLVKLFLDAFRIEPKRLAKAWKIDLANVYRVQLSNNYQVYKSVNFPDEDILLAVEGFKK